MPNCTSSCPKRGTGEGCDRTHPAHDGDGLEREEPRVADLVVDDGVEDLLLVVPGKRGLADEHLEDEDAQAPPVDRPRVRRLGQHL